MSLIARNASWSSPLMSLTCSSTIRAKGVSALMEPRSGPTSIIRSSGTSEASVVTQVQLEAGLLPPPSSNAASRVSTSSFWPRSCHAREGS